MADLITPYMLAQRLGPSYTVDNTQAFALIADASALVRQAARGQLDTADDTTVPAAVVPVVVSAVRRALTNPDGHSSAAIDDYKFSTRHTDGVFLTRAERQAVARACDLLPAVSAPLTADVPYPEGEELQYVERELGIGP